MKLGNSWRHLPIGVRSPRRFVDGARGLQTIGIHHFTLRFLSPIHRYHRSPVPAQNSVLTGRGGRVPYFFSSLFQSRVSLPACSRKVSSTVSILSGLNSS